MRRRAGLLAGGLGVLLLLGPFLIRGGLSGPFSEPPPSMDRDRETAAAGDSLPVPPMPPRIAQGPDYDYCLSLLRSDLAGAAIYAEAWQATGGGDGALQCRALAQLGAGQVKEGAEALEKLGIESRAPAAGRASVLAQAGQAWLMADDPSRAYTAITLALSLNADDPDLLIGRSVAAASLNRFQDAMDDLNRALSVDPARTDALVFRGAAWRHLDKLDLARADIDKVLVAQPQNAEALLERGILRQRGGDLAGARTDWQLAADQDSDRESANLARQNLSLLDSGAPRNYTSFTPRSENFPGKSLGNYP